MQRKDLAQKTKDFRKLDDAAKLGEVKGLLKGERVIAQSVWNTELTFRYSIPDVH